VTSVRRACSGAALALACALAVAACDVPPAASPSTPPPAAFEVEVEVAQLRTDRVARAVSLEVRNSGPDDLRVEAARLVTPLVEGTSVAERGREIGADGMRRLRVPLGAAVCTPQAEQGRPARVELDVTDVHGRAQTLVVTPTDETEDLRRIHGEDCAAAAVAAGLRLRLAEDLPVRQVDGTSVADVTLLVEPVPGGPHVQLVAVRGTTLLRSTDPTGQWEVQVDSAAPPADGRLVLPAVPARCDLHAVAEDKRGTVLGIRAVVDGVEQPVFHVAASDALRGALYDFVLAACGTPTDLQGG